MTQRSVKNFDIENVAEPGVLDTILELSVNFLTLMACLGQPEYVGDDFHTVKHFEREPYKYLVAHKTNQMDWKKTPERLVNSKGFGVGMTIPKNSLILLDSNVLYPVVYLKKSSNTEYTKGQKMPTGDDEDNVFVIREQSLDMAVMQALDIRTEVGGTNPGRVNKLAESVKVRHTHLLSDFLRLPVNGNHNLQTEEGHKMTAVIKEAEVKSDDENGLKDKYLSLGYYNYYDYTQEGGINPNCGENKGKLIVVMPYISARHDMLGQISFNDSTDPAIILTTT